MERPHYINDLAGCIAAPEIAGGGISVCLGTTFPACGFPALAL